MILFFLQLLQVLDLLKSLLLLVELLGLFDLLLPEVKESLNLFSEGVLFRLTRGDALAADQGSDNASTHNEGQDKSVHAIPMRG